MGSNKGVAKRAGIISKPKGKGFTSKGVERTSEVEPYSFYETSEYDETCQKVLKAIKKLGRTTHFLTIGACSRHFFSQNDFALRYPLLDILQTLRKQGMINFIQKGEMTQIQLGGTEIKPDEKKPTPFARMRID